ncbi:hypothetical protein [Sphingobacterium cavernae]|uniref:hypothetical protein n=1 Tax=Sphingobacterium cavernae TaxID=2592657 RepID=UPI00122FC035|nr:hypothetical protein [Sphingobacterium cavernae]
MKREQIQQWIEEGYHVLERSGPIKIAGDILYYLLNVDEEDKWGLVLEDLLKWSDEKLLQLQ